MCVVVKIINKQMRNMQYFRNSCPMIKYKGCLSIEGGWVNFETRFAPAWQYMQQQFLAL